MLQSYLMAMADGQKNMDNQDRLVIIKVEEIFEVVFYRYDWGPVLILAYHCQLLTKALHNIGVAEHRWVHPQDLPGFPILPADQPILDRLNFQLDRS